MTVDVEIVRDGDDLRRQVQQLHAGVGSTLSALAEALHRIEQGKLYKAWGFTSFAHYVASDLEMKVSVAYQCVEVYRRYQVAWEDARRVAWNRLVEACPLITAGKKQPRELVVELADPKTTVKKIRAVKDQLLRTEQPHDKPPEGATVERVRGDAGSIDEWVTRHPDMTVGAIHRANGVRWVEVTMRLPQPVLTELVEACLLARRMLGIERAPEDDRATIHRELEAMCQEVLPEWRSRLAHEEER